MTRCAACLVFLAVLTGPSAATAQQSERPEFVRVRIGFDHRYKVGQWTPVDVTLRGGTRSVTGIVTLTTGDDDGTPTRVGREATPANTCQVLPGAESTVRMYVKFGRTDPELTAELHAPVQSGGKTVAGPVIAEKRFDTRFESDETHFRPAMAATQELFVTVGPASVGLEEAIALTEQAEMDQPQMERETVAVRLGDVDQLPTRWYGYEGVDVVVLATSVPEIYRKLAPGGARLKALDEWLRMGGELLLCVGSQADEVLAKDAPLAGFAPGRLAEIVTLRSTAALESYAGSSTPVPGMAGGSIMGLRVPRLADVTGTVEAADGRLPLVVRAPYGLGQVIFVGADLERPPFTKWRDRGRLLNKLLDRTPVKVDESPENAGMMHYGYDDMAGRLRALMEEFTGVRMVPFWVVAGLIFLYILLIGPGDYFFLRKVVGRMQWTWLTFPAVVLVVSLGAYGLAYWLKGDQLRVNQVDLVDVDVAGGQARGTTWLNFFSPRTDTYNLSFQPMSPDGEAAEGAEVVASWLGLPGEGLGSMRSRTSNPQLWSHGYDFLDELRAMGGVPVQVWSTKSLTARWHAPCALYPQAELAEEDGLPRGKITNTLDFSLSNCILAYGRWGYGLGELAPGASVRIEPMSRERVELRTLLAGGTLGDAVEEINRRQRRHSPRYGASDGNLPDALRTMMFFEALGGRRQEEGLSNRYQHFVDGSGLLKTGRAILVAGAGGGFAFPQRHGAVLMRDDQPMAHREDRHTVMYRFVFPVERNKSQ